MKKFLRKILNTTEKRDKAKLYITILYLFYFLMPIVIMSGLLHYILIIIFFPAWMIYFALMYAGLGYIYVVFTLITAYLLNIFLKNIFLKFDDAFNLDLDDLYNSYLGIIDDLQFDLANSSDSKIETYLNENAEIAIDTIFHQVNLKKLYSNNYISRDEFFKSKKLHKLVRKLQHTEYWNVESVKTLDEWKEIFEVSNNLRAIIHTQSHK